MKNDTAFISSFGNEFNAVACESSSHLEQNQYLASRNKKIEYPNQLCGIDCLIQMCMEEIKYERVFFSDHTLLCREGHTANETSRKFRSDLSKKNSKKDP